MTPIEAIPFSKKFTRDEISNMLASRKMDAIIANFVMGWDSVTTLRMVDGELTGIKREEAGIMYVDTVPNYSTDIAAAWQVVEKLKEKWEIVDVWHQRNVGLDWYCEVVGNGTGEFANENTAPLAICRAALLATLED